MTRDDIIRLSKEAGVPMEYSFNNGATVWDLHPSLERFAARVAAAERAACAQVCDDIRYNGYCPPEDGAAPDYYNSAAEECAAAIRARGET
jgi:hypothetical protein